MEQTKKTQNVEAHPGRILYNTKIRPIVDTPENLGKFCIVDPDSGNYEVDADSLAAGDRLRVRHPGKISWGERIGYRGYCEFSGLYSGLRKDNVVEQTNAVNGIEAHPGRALYQERIRLIVETDENIGKYCIIDPVTGDYEVDADSIAASDRLRARHPDLIYWGERIGYKSLASFGSTDWRARKK